MFCNNCGAQFPDGSKFCIRCGATIPNESVPKEFAADSRTAMPPTPPVPPAPQKQPKKKANPILIVVIVVLALVIGSLFGKLFIAPAFSGGADNTTTTTTNMFGEIPTVGIVDEPSTSSTQQDTASISRGKINGNVYTNDFAEITFTKPSDWVYYSDDELSALIESGAEIMDLDDIEKILNESGTFIDMGVESPSNASYYQTVSVSFEDLKRTNALSLSEEEYLEIAVKNLTSTSSGFNVQLKDMYTKKLGSKNFTVAILTLEMNGVNISERIYVRKIGNYMLGITMMSDSELSFGTLELMFS